MSVLSPPMPFSPPPEPQWRPTVEQYLRMVETGILTDQDRVELLEGCLVQKMPRNPPHDVSLFLTQDCLARLLPAEWICRGQSATTTAESVPEPDIAIVRGPIRRYAERHPGPGDIALVVEISDTSLTRDRTTKARIYAAAAIAVYWIVNLPDRCLEILADPTGPVEPPAAATYRHRDVLAPGASVPLVLDGREIATIPVAEFLP